MNRNTSKFSDGSYIPVKLTTLRPGDVLDFKLYLLQEETRAQKYILYLGKNVAYEPKEGVEALYIRRSDEYLYWEYIKNVRKLLKRAKRSLRPVSNKQQTTKTQETQPETLYRPVRVDTLLVDVPMDFELLRQDKKDKHKYISFKDGNKIFDQEQYTFLKNNNIELLYVPKSHSDTYWDYQVDNLVDILLPETITIDEKVNIIYRVILEAAKKLFTKPVSAQFITRTRNLMNIVVQQITHHHEFHKLVEKFSDQYTLYSHSANVCIIGIALARTFGINNIVELTSFAHGLLLHDIGKRMISKSIMNKNGMLSSKELAEIHRHPLLGAEIMQHHKQVDDIAIDIILHHHEKLDGYGYPHSLIGAQISTAARIAAIADVYDVMTTQRSYQEPYRGFTALKIMREKMTKELDNSLLEILVRLFSPKQKKSNERTVQPVES